MMQITCNTKLLPTRCKILIKFAAVEMCHAACIMIQVCSIYASWDIQMQRAQEQMDIFVGTLNKNQQNECESKTLMFENLKFNEIRRIKYRLGILNLTLL